MGKMCDTVPELFGRSSSQKIGKTETTFTVELEIHTETSRKSFFVGDLKLETDHYRNIERGLM